MGLEQIVFEEQKRSGITLLVSGGISDGVSLYNIFYEFDSIMN